MSEQSINVATLIDSRPISSFQLYVFLLCGLVVLLDGIDYQVIAIAAPLISRELGIERGVLGWVFAAGPLGAAIGGLTCGLIADRFGRQRTLTATTCLFGVATFATAYASDFASLLTLRFITGLGLGGAVPCFIALTSKYAPRRRRASIVSRGRSCRSGTRTRTATTTIPATGFAATSSPTSAAPGPSRPSFPRPTDCARATTTSRFSAPMGGW